MNPPRIPSSARPGFSLVEVTLAIGIVGVAILSLVGILGSTFQQVDEIMQTNRALSGVTRLIGALDNPRSIVYLDAAGEKVPNNTKYLMDAAFKESMALYSEVSAKNPNWKKVYDDYASFRKESNNWFRVADARFDNYMQSRLADL
jgi:Tfp pilus assembly protein PilV